ncbi:hypothetical protein APV28_2417 [Comamonas testosteroni]|nr:hypothetical protein APV28_2417 [Comamonas testosteroni]
MDNKMPTLGFSTKIKRSAKLFMDGGQQRPWFVSMFVIKQET